jgi:hypothetical protein
VADADHQAAADADIVHGDREGIAVAREGDVQRVRHPGQLRSGVEDEWDLGWEWRTRIRIGK